VYKEIHIRIQLHSLEIGKRHEMHPTVVDEYVSWCANVEKIQRWERSETFLIILKN